MLLCNVHTGDKTDCARKAKKCVEMHAYNHLVKQYLTLIAPKSRYTYQGLIITIGCACNQRFIVFFQGKIPKVLAVQYWPYKIVSVAVIVMFYCCSLLMKKKISILLSLRQLYLVICWNVTYNIFIRQFSVLDTLYVILIKYAYM